MARRRTKKYTRSPQSRRTSAKSSSGMLYLLLIILVIGLLSFIAQHPIILKSAVALVFNRLRQRVSISQKNIHASLVRESFAVRYLQTGGDRQTLLELLGQQKSAIIACSVGKK